ncbi:unnamed protein product [Macrosiphum euphorbiae]|uniref:Uncharacterized protein n=1 Tax=Macrosiphum euphorbiae TaxID=13131 RepID=A0AAV0VIR9_9HEMI|nr:unnamed protein product [Macrosiphum euphorbiae]
MLGLRNDKIKSESTNNSCIADHIGTAAVEWTCSNAALVVGCRNQRPRRKSVLQEVEEVVQRQGKSLYAWDIGWNEERPVGETVGISQLDEYA